MTPQQRISIFKYSVILIAIVLLFLLFRKCGSGGGKMPTSDTVRVVIDTMWISSKTDTFYTPKGKEIVYKKEYKTDTLETIEVRYRNVDTAAILKDYFATRHYEDTAKVQYGEVYISDAISENKIKQRRLRTNFNIPVVKETVTFYQPKRNIFYTGFGAMGSDKSFLEQTEISLGLKTKNDKLYSVSGALSREGNVLFGGRILIPIRLNKK